MIDIMYAALLMRPQTEKTTFSCKDKSRKAYILEWGQGTCTLLKHIYGAGHLPLCSIFQQAMSKGNTVNLQSGHISPSVQKVKKLKENYFLQLRRQTAHSFLNFGPEAEILAFSEFVDGTLLTWLTENEKKAVSQPLSKNLKKPQALYFLQLLKCGK